MGGLQEKTPQEQSSLYAKFFFFKILFFLDSRNAKCNTILWEEGRKPSGELIKCPCKYDLRDLGLLAIFPKTISPPGLLAGQISNLRLSLGENE